MRNKLVRITTVPMSLNILLKDQLAYIDKFFEVLAVSSPGNDLDEVARREKVRVLPIQMTRKISPLRDLVALAHLFFAFLRERPLIVHSHTPKAGLLAMMAAKATGVPNRIHTVAGLPLMEATGLKRLLLLMAEKLTYACTTHILANSEGLRSYMIEEIGVSSSKLSVIAKGSSNGIDTSYFDLTRYVQEQVVIINEEYELADNFVFTYCGRLVSDKGINELIEAFGRLNSEVSTCRLILVGWEEPDLDPLSKKTIAAIKDNPNIIFVGYQSDVRPYIALSDCFVFPSYREGFPNVLLQAQALSVPCIVSDINGCNEIITDDVNGYLIGAKDVSSLHRAMKHVVTNPHELREMKDKARALIEKSYSRKIFMRDLLDFYNALL